MTCMSPHTPKTQSNLTTAHLRAFIYGDSMKAERPALLRHTPDAIARALVRLPSEEAARCLALLPAGAQIAIVTRLDRDTRARLGRDCQDWACAIPILRGFQLSVARHGMLGQMTPLGRTESQAT